MRKVSRPLSRPKTTISRPKPTEALPRERPVAKTMKENRVKTAVQSAPKATEEWSKVITSNPVEQPAEHAADVWTHEVEDKHPAEEQHFEDQWSRETDDMIIPQQKQSQESEDDDLKEPETRLEGVVRELDRETMFEEPRDELRKPETDDTVEENNGGEIQVLDQARESKAQTRDRSHEQSLGNTMKQDVAGDVKRVGQTVAVTESVRKADRQDMKPVDGLKGKMAAGNKQGTRITLRGGNRKPLPAQRRQNSITNRNAARETAGDEMTRYRDSEGRMSQNAVKMGGDTEVRRKSALSRLLKIPDERPEKTQPLMNVAGKMQEESKSKSENEDVTQRHTDLAKEKVVDVESKRLRRDQDLEQLPLRVRNRDNLLKRFVVRGISCQSVTYCFLSCSVDYWP